MDDDATSIIVPVIIIKYVVMRNGDERINRQQVFFKPVAYCSFPVPVAVVGIICGLVCP